MCDTYNRALSLRYGRHLAGTAATARTWHVPSDSAPTVLALDAQSLRLSGVTASDHAWRVDRAENAAYVFTVTGHGSNNATTTIQPGQSMDCLLYTSDAADE